MVDRKLDLGPGWIGQMLDDYRRQEVSMVIRKEEIELYSRAASETDFSIAILAYPGGEYFFDVTGDDEFSDGRRKIYDGELVIEVLPPEGQKERDYSVFWKTFEQLKQEAQQPY